MGEKKTIILYSSNRSVSLTELLRGRNVTLKLN